MPGVEDQAEVRRAHFIQQRDGFRDRGDQRPVFADRTVNRLQAHTNADARGRPCDDAQTLHDNTPRFRFRERAAWPRQADARGRLESRKAPNAGADCPDAPGRVGRPRQQRQWQNRKRGGNADRGAQAAGAKRRERGRVVAVGGQLEFTDAGALRAAFPAGREVLLEARRESRDFADRETRHRRPFRRCRRLPVGGERSARGARWTRRRRRLRGATRSFSAGPHRNGFRCVCGS